MSTEQITTIVLAILSSSVISTIVSALVSALFNRNKLNAEVQHLHAEAATDTISNYKSLVADQRTHIEGLNARAIIADQSIAILPTMTRRVEETEAELKREREQSAALRTLIQSQPNNNIMIQGESP